MLRLPTLFVFMFFLLLRITSLQAQTGSFQHQEIYIYNKGKDTLLLENIDNNDLCLCDPVKMIDTIQIDGQGAKELVLYRNCSCTKEDHGGTFDISEHKAISRYEVWNPDNKTLLFTAVNSFMYDYNRFLAYETPSHQNGKNAYKYDFKIDGKGVITIKNLSDDDVTKPDHEEGVYKFVNGKYEKE